MLRLSPTIIMPGSYPSPTTRNQTPPTPAEIPFWMSPMSHFAHLSGTELSSAMSQTPSSDEGQRAGSQSSHRVPARMSIRRRSYRSGTEALDGAVSPSGSSMSLYRAPSRMSVRKRGYSIDAEEVDGEAEASDVVSPSGSSFSLYRAPSRMSVRKRGYEIDAEEVDGQAEASDVMSGSGSLSSLYRAPSRMSFRRRGYTIDAEEVEGEASGSGSSQSPNRVVTRMPIRRRSYTTGTEDLEAENQQSSDILSGSGSSLSLYRPPERMSIRRRSYTTRTEALNGEARQSPDKLSGSESPQFTGHRASFHLPSRSPTPFMLNTFISIANQYAETSLDSGGQQGLTFMSRRENKDPSASQQPYQPSRSYQGSNVMSDKYHNPGHELSAAATKSPDNTNIAKWPGPVNRTSTPFPHGAKYNTSPARLQHVSTTQHPVSPASTPRSLPYQYDIAQDPFRDSFSNYPLTLDPPTSASSASPPNPPPERHDTPSSTTQTFHPGFGLPPPTDPTPYPNIRSSPLYKGPPELKHFAPNQTPRQKIIPCYYEPLTDSFHPIQKPRPSAFTARPVNPRSPASSPLSVYPRPPKSSPEPMFPRRPTVKSPLNQRIWLGSPGSFDRLPEYTGDTPSPPLRERRRVMVGTLGSEGGEMEGKKEWRERMKGWFKVKGRGGWRWWREGMVRRDGDVNGGGNKNGVENRIGVVYRYGVEYGNGDRPEDSDRKRLVDRVKKKLGGEKLKERVKKMLRRG